MAFGTFSTFLLVGSALTGLWLALRLPRLTPRSLPGAAALLVVTMFFATVVAPAFVRLAVARLPFANVFVLRYFVGAMAPSSAGRR